MTDPRVQKTADWCRHWGDVHGVDDMEAVAQLIERLAREKAELQAKVDELEDRIKWLEINWCNPNGDDE